LDSSAQTIVGDFEKAIIKAMHNVVPDAEYIGCYFHFVQALWKNIVQIGLKTHYSKNKEVNKWLKLFKSLPFIPLDRMQAAIDILKNNYTK
jgi:hypothetical protein